MRAFGARRSAPADAGTTRQKTTLMLDKPALAKRKKIEYRKEELYREKEGKQKTRLVYYW